ncbi:MAG TPA: TolC family protein [Kofleriaceae bacterium]|nr:TolC family protein [Kofleriaceae bacterium]
MSRTLLVSLALVMVASAEVGAQPPAARTGDAAAELQRAFAAEVGVAGGLTAAHAAERALVHSPSAAARREDVAIADSQLAGTKLEFLPRATLTGRYTRLSSTGDTEIEGLPVPVTLPGALEDQWSVGVQVAVPLSDYVLRLGHAVRARRHSTRAAEWMSRAERRQAAAQARLAYYDWARATLGVLVAERARTQAAQHRDLAGRRVAAASATRADLLLAESRLGEAEELVTRAQLDANLAERQLRVVMGERGRAQLAIGEDVLAPLPGGEGDAERLVGVALAARPELRALGEGDGALAAEARLEAARYFPRLDLVGNVARENPNSRAFPQSDEFDTVWDVSLVLSWAFDDIPRAREKRRELAARRRRVDDERRQLVDGIVLEVTQAVQQVKAAEKSIATTGGTLVAAEEGHRVRQRLFEVGSASSTELGDAENDLTRARFAVIDAHIALRKAHVALDRAVGK